ncbi:hypothetical protein [Nannocystis pusilla]|uniref:Uncharacterized protein n=1 Tax=Nannocystis pusilla TaxID=889268 RepID=A0ABS7TI43_9BACT|nr:hypothetical protein [Nannocystis pusilla]MBZ5707791.1 hypothetical protein [Nannocystis pusilla]
MAVVEVERAAIARWSMLRALTGDGRTERVVHAARGVRVAVSPSEAASEQAAG